MRYSMPESELDILRTRGGGRSTHLMKNPKPTDSVVKGCLVSSSFRPSFIEIGVMASITSA